MTAYPGGRIIATTTLAAAVAFLSACESATNNRTLPSGNGLATSPTHEQKFSYTGTPQQFNVPQNVSKVTVDALGARGAGTNGAGARVLATIPVTPGETLAVYVGGQGNAANGGYNGGASGGPSGPGQGGFGGGGASDIRARPATNYPIAFSSLAAAAARAAPAPARAAARVETAALASAGAAKAAGVRPEPEAGPVEVRSTAAAMPAQAEMPATFTVSPEIADRSAAAEAEALPRAMVLAPVAPAGVAAAVTLAAAAVAGAAATRSLARAEAVVAAAHRTSSRAR